jgi:hypothetical protein
MTDTAKPYELTFEDRPRLYLYALVKAETASPDIIREYLLEILGKCDGSGHDQVLIEREIHGALSSSDAFLVGGRLLESGIGHVQIALVDRNRDNDRDLEFAVLLLNNRGANVRHFNDIPDAEAWLLAS